MLSLVRLIGILSFFIFIAVFALDLLFWTLLSINSESLGQTALFCLMIFACAAALSRMENKTKAALKEHKEGKV